MSQHARYHNDKIEVQVRVIYYLNKGKSLQEKTLRPSNYNNINHKVNEVIEKRVIKNIFEPHKGQKNNIVWHFYNKNEKIKITNRIDDVLIRLIDKYTLNVSVLHALLLVFSIYYSDKKMLCSVIGEYVDIRGNRRSSVRQAGVLNAIFSDILPPHTLFNKQIVIDQEFDEYKKEEYKLLTRTKEEYKLLTRTKLEYSEL